MCKLFVSTKNKKHHVFYDIRLHLTGTLYSTTRAGPSRESRRDAVRTGSQAQTSRQGNKEYAHAKKCSIAAPWMLHDQHGGHAFGLRMANKREWPHCRLGLRTCGSLIAHACVMCSTVDGCGVTTTSGGRDLLCVREPARRSSEHLPLGINLRRRSLGELISRVKEAALAEEAALPSSAENK
jgi:hypothetical protein